MRINLVNGHLLLQLPDGEYIIDTGSPFSISLAGGFDLGEGRISLPATNHGHTAAIFSELVNHQVQGLIGFDIINRYNVVFNVPSSEVEFSAAPLNMAGETVQLASVRGGYQIITAIINGKSYKLVFDTAAPVSYLKSADLRTFPPAGKFADFIPNLGEFSVDTFKVEMRLGTLAVELRCGEPTTEVLAKIDDLGTTGIIGSDLLLNRKIGYFPKKGELVI